MKHCEWSFKCNLSVGSIYSTEILKSNFYDYNEAYILVRGSATIAATPQTQ